MQLAKGPEAIAAVRQVLEAAQPLAAVEIDPDARRGAPLRLLCVASGDTSVLVDVAGTPGLAAALAGPDRPLGAFDAKAVHRALLAAGGAGPSRWACAVLTEALLAGGRDADLSPAAIAQRHLGATLPEAEAGFEALAARARAAARVVATQIPAVKRDELTWVSRLEAAAVAPIAEMEHAGMPFDAAGWRAIDAEVRAEREQVRRDLAPLFAKVTGSDLFGGAALNLESDQDLKKALTQLGYSLPNVRRETLATLPEPLGGRLTRYRELTKLASSYGESFLEHVGADGRLHCTFEQIGANTGRMACHSPNLQSIVKDAPHRQCFRVADDRRLVTADYAACELRIIAELSGDPVFAEAFARGEDLHARVATAVFGVPVSKRENPELRQRAKAVNFGLAYGMGAQGLARAIDAELPQAQQLLERYFKSFPKIRTFLERSAAEGLRRGYARTMTGRRLYLDVGDDGAARGHAERVAKNMPIQGTNADITKIALARLRTRLAGFAGAAVVNAVHDEIVVECAAREVDAVGAAVAEEMRAAGAQVLQKIPLEVEVAVGQTWGK